MKGINSLTPRETVAELDRYIIGQPEAKRSVAIALRNRWRRQQVEPPLREEIAPKNIIMIGPTGVGKTEIARRLAHLAQSPFLKIEASKFTEVGYVGRDVESMIRDLTQLAVNMVTKEAEEGVQGKAAAMAEERGGQSLRWQALRECLGLDTALGFATVCRIAAQPDDPLSAPAGALRAQLLETYPQLEEVAECRM